MKRIFFAADKSRYYDSGKVSYTEHCTDKYYLLEFDSGKWLIPGDFLYNWSSEGKMSIDNIKFTSEKGDEFYIVTYGKSKKIGCAYNKKFFTLIERPRHDEKPKEEVFH